MVRIAFGEREGVVRVLSYCVAEVVVEPAACCADTAAVVAAGDDWTGVDYDRC